jgi:hypothetical protein
MRKPAAKDGATAALAASNEAEQEGGKKQERVE